MSNRVNYIYSTDYKGYQLPQGISLSASKNGNNINYAQQQPNGMISQAQNSSQPISQSSTFSYQPAASKENIATTGPVPVQTYLQHLSYSTQSGRTVQRTASPMIIQHSRHYSNNTATSNPSSATKYSVPAYQQNGTLQNSLSTEKNEPLSHSLIGSSYIQQQQQTAPFNNSQALRSPYVSSFTPSTTTTSSSQMINGNGRSSNSYNGSSAYTTTPTIAQSLVLSSGNSSSQIMNQSLTASAVIGGSGSNINNSANSTSFSAVYSSLSANKPGISNSSAANGDRSAQKQSSNGYLSKPSNAYTHTRALSTNTPQRLDSYYQQSHLSPREGLARQDSLSPSKRVTFNLARNTYTDIEQIEKRLNESTKLRPAEEVDDSRDRTPTATFQPTVYEDDLNKRFDQAIYRSERIISDCLRIGREGIQYRNALENSVSANGSTTPVGPKMVRNPSRSKSPIKSSLKRTSSFTGSPMKASVIETIQQFSDMIENPLQNQTNKVANNLISSEQAAYSIKQTSSILQPSSTIENQSKQLTYQAGTANAASSSSQPNSSSTPQTSFLTNSQCLNSQSNEKAAISSQNTLLTSTQQKQGGNNYEVYDENRYVSASQVSQAGGARSVTPTKYGTSTASSSTSNNYSVTSAYNTQISSSNAQRTSLQQRSQKKENDQIFNSVTPTKNENNDTVEVMLLKKSESSINNNTETKDQEAKQQENGKFTNDQKRYTLQYTPPIKPRQGILRYSDSSRYDGEILNNQRHGYGTLLSSEFQVIYQGDWQNDTYHGQGKFFNPLSENLFDEYEYNDFDVALSQYWESYEGEFFEGKLDGFGTLMLTNGEKLVGNFKKGRISGKGTFYCNKGPAITGNWEDNRLLEKY